MNNTTVNSDNAAFLLLCEYAREGETRGAIHQNLAGATTRHPFLAFRAGQKKYLIPVQDMVEVSRDIQEPTKLPFSPPWLLGLSAARGQVFSILDLACLIERNPTPAKTTLTTSFVLLGRKGEGFMLRVDEVLGMKDFDLNDADTGKTFVTKIVQRDNDIWHLIDVGQLVTEEFIFSQQP